MPEIQKRGVGRPPEAGRGFWKEYFHLSANRAKHLTIQMIEQLDNCKDDMARRLLVGKSELYELDELDVTYK